VVVPPAATLPAADAPPTRSLVRAGDPRPLDTTVGVVLMVVAAMSTVLSGVLLVSDWKQVIAEARATAATADDVILIPWVVGAILALSAVVTLCYLVLAWRVHRGGNLARLLTMAFSSTSIATLATTYLAGAGGLTLQTNLIGFAVDCSIILALSGTEARDWARGRQRRTRRTKA
jgi:hypothetical protein